MCVLVFANIVRLCPLFDGVTGVSPRFWGYQTLTLIFKKIFKKNDKKGTLPPSPPAGSCKSLFLFNPNDNDSHLLFTNFTKKILTLGFTLIKNGFRGIYKNLVLGMGPPSLTPTGPKLGYRLLKKPPIPHYDTSFHIMKRTAVLRMRLIRI